MTLFIGWMQWLEKLLLDTLNLECSRLMTLLKLFQQLDLPQTYLWCVFLLFHSIYVQKHILWFGWSLNLIFGRNLIYLFFIYLILRPMWILLFFFFLGIVIIFKHWRGWQSWDFVTDEVWDRLRVILLVSVCASNHFVYQSCAYCALEAISPW